MQEFVKPHLIIFLVASLIFWISNLISHIVIGEEHFGLKSVVFITLFLPTITLGAILYLIHLYERVSPLGGTLVAALGVWVAGPIYMMMSERILGRGGAEPDWEISIISLTLIFPITTFSFATYDGSLFALLISTVGFFAYGMMGKG